MWCVRLAGNTERKNDSKNRHLRTNAQFCLAVSSQLRRVSTIEKKLLNINTSSTRLHNIANFGPLTAEIGSGVWGTAANFNGFRVCLRYCSDVAHRRPTKLCTTFDRLLGCYTIYTFSAALALWQNFARCKIHLRRPTSKSWVRQYWQRYCTALHQPNFAASYKEWNYGTFAQGATFIQQGGYHFGHRSTL